MNATSANLNALRHAILQPANGVVGVVGDVLALCKEHGLNLDWQAEKCRVFSVDGYQEEVIDLPLRKSVFRAILARVATLCSEQVPESFSPYSGHGDLTVGSDSTKTIRVAWVNTLAEQRLRLVHADTSRDTSSPLGRLNAQPMEGAPSVPQRNG